MFYMEKNKWENYPTHKNYLIQNYLLKELENFLDAAFSS